MPEAPLLPQYFADVLGQIAPLDASCATITIPTAFVASILLVARSREEWNDCAGLVEGGPHDLSSGIDRIGGQ
jgi:hypothetical protein